MRPDIEKEIDRLQDRNVDIQREVSTQLWSSLLVVIGTLLTVLIGVAAFRTPINETDKIILGTVIFFLILSSTLIVWNFITTKSVYHRIGEVLNSATNLSDADKKRDINSALANNRRMSRIERFAVFSIVASVVFLFVFIYISLI